MSKSHSRMSSRRESSCEQRQAGLSLRGRPTGRPVGPRSPRLTAASLPRPQKGPPPPSPSPPSAPHALAPVCFLKHLLFISTQKDMHGAATKRWELCGAHIAAVMRTMMCVSCSAWALPCPPPAPSLVKTSPICFFLRNRKSHFV